MLRRESRRPRADLPERRSSYMQPRTAVASTYATAPKLETRPMGHCHWLSPDATLHPFGAFGGGCCSLPRQRLRARPRAASHPPSSCGLPPPRVRLRNAGARPAAFFVAPLPRLSTWPGRPGARRRCRRCWLRGALPERPFSTRSRPLGCNFVGSMAKLVLSTP